MNPRSVREYAEAIRGRYLAASRLGKGLILEEFCLTTGYHRKAAIRLLHERFQPQDVHPGRKAEYGSLVASALNAVWEASDYLCSKRLHPFLGELIAALERHGEISLAPEIRDQLLRLSPATMDRLLKPYRQRGLRRPYLSSRAQAGLKALIPIRTFADWAGLDRVGYLEGDLVAHCGESTAGSYLHTLDTIDIASGWTELIAVFGRHQDRVGGAVDQIRCRLPFDLRGLDCDNGSEFVNQGLYDYCRRHQIEFTRSRPYKKNDQAHVEQRNWYAIRRVVGYDRYSSKAAFAQLGQVYALLQDHLNFFEPIRKLKSKDRVDGKVRKRYDRAETPYQRLARSGQLTPERAESLRRQYERLNPVRLRCELEQALEKLWTLGELTKPTSPISSKRGELAGTEADGKRVVGGQVFR